MYIHEKMKLHDALEFNGFSMNLTSDFNLVDIIVLFSGFISLTIHDKQKYYII